MRIRVQYAKGYDLRFIGHLDLYRAWERLIRRASLPIAYTLGFNPHPKINMSPALPLGFTSRCELIDFWLEAERTLQEIEFSLKKAIPPGLTILMVNDIPENYPTIQTQITSVRYKITLLEWVPDLDPQVKSILLATTLPRQRRGKIYDLRYLIERCDVSEDAELQTQQIFIQLASRDGATGRPDEFLTELKIPIQFAHVERLEFIGTLQDAAASMG